MQPTPTTKPGFNIPGLQQLKGLGPVVALVLLCIAGALLNPDFATVDNLLNVLTRTAFIGIIAVGMTFVIVSGGIDLSVGSMAALIAGGMIVAMNALAASASAPVVIVLGIALALAVGAVFGVAHGLLVSRGRIEPFIVTLGTLGIFRAVLTWLSDGGALNLDFNVAETYGPVYYQSVLGVPIPVWVFALVAIAGAVVLNRTAYGQHVQAIGSNEQVARYAAIRVDRVKVLTYLLLDHRHPVGAGSDCGRRRRRHLAARRRRARDGHGGRRGPAVRDRQHPEPHQHHQRAPEPGRAGRGDHRRGLPAARPPLNFIFLTQESSCAHLLFH
jgi:ribose transport system permease protein